MGRKSPQTWFGMTTKTIKQGYSQAQTDHTLFYKHKDGKTTILIIHVDDIILTRDDVREREKLKKTSAKEFEVKYLSFLIYFLGMEVTRNRSGITISQRKYILRLVGHWDVRL